MGPGGQRQRLSRNRYDRVGGAYDLLSLEWPLYRAGRIRGIELLDPRLGDVVLDVGCGTGLDFPLLQERVGKDGTIVGVDTSLGMLRQARGRIDKAGWGNIHLVQADAAVLDSAVLQLAGGACDRVLFTYSLSVIPRWRQAWDHCVRLARPAARVAVVDVALPDQRVMRSLAQLACMAGASDPHRQPWTLVAENTNDAHAEGLRGGHIRVAAGTLR